MKFKIDRRKKVTKIELPTGGYLKVIKLEGYYSVYIYGSKIASHVRDISVEEAEETINELLNHSGIPTNKYVCRTDTNNILIDNHTDMNTAVKYFTNHINKNYSRPDLQYPLTITDNLGNEKVVKGTIPIKTKYS